MQRRAFLTLAASAPFTTARADAAPSFDAALAAIERRSGGRLGVCVLDLRDGRRLSHRAHERFPTASTFKLPLVMATLARVDAGRESLTRRLRYAPADVLDYAPVARERVAAGFLSVEEACAAAVERSDNTSANLLLRPLGGPAALTRYVRSLGDTSSRFDRYEPALNAALPGDPRDTSTPEAMALVAARLLRRPVLSAASNARLVAWLRGSRTGLRRLRAGVPRDWSVGDKTGSTRISVNDLAIVTRPSGGPLVIAAYLTGTNLDADGRDAALADVGRAVGAVHWA